MYVCGLVTIRNSERNITKIVLEDPSGSFEGIIFDEELQKTAGTLLMDQFVMARIGSAKNSGYIIKDLIFPDIPDQAKNKSESDAYAVFLSDLHIGSKYFMEEEFSDFVSWISSPDPVARKIRFVLIGGDIVDGVGIYPNQNKELVCQTIQEQLKKAEDLIDKIPKNVKIIITMAGKGQGSKTRFLKLDRQFFVEFSDQTILGCLAGFEFPAREFPQAGHRFSIRPPGNQYSAIGID